MFRTGRGIYNDDDDDEMEHVQLADELYPASALYTLSNRKLTIYPIHPYISMYIPPLVLSYIIGLFLE